MIYKIIYLVILIKICHAEIRELIPLEAPENLTLLDIVEKEVIVSWEPVRPESVRGTFRGYLVRIWNHGSSQVYAIPPDVTRTGVEFFPYSKNFITVAVRNEKYVGPRSEAISFDAPQTEPSLPFLFDWHQLGSKSVYLQWKKPTQPNGILLGYKIYISETTDFGIDEKTKKSYLIDNPDTVQAKITGLRQGKKYQFSISAINCIGESERNTLEAELEEHTPAPPSYPFFRYKINYTDFDLKDHATQCAETKNILSKYDDFDADDYYIFNDTKTSKVVKPEDVTKAEQDFCLVKCLITWLPDIDNNPGENFYVKYRLKGEKEYQRSEVEAERDFIVLENFNGCKNYEIVLVAVDGDFETESDMQETPAVLFMTKH